MSISSLIDHIAESLNDRENITWSRSFLLTAVTEGFCLAAKFRPDMFVKTVTVKLNPGRIQRVCECSVIKNIVAQVDKFGNEIKTIPRIENKLANRWTGKRRCSAGYSVEGYTFDKTNNQEFEVSPPVPHGETVYVQLSCVLKTDGLTEDSEAPDCGLEAAVVQWVLFRALAVDNQDVSMSSANIHRQQFDAMLERQYIQHMRVQATPETEKVK